MPLIPTLDESQRMSPNSPVEIASPSEAAHSYDGLDSLGQGIANIGAAIGQMAKKKEAVKRTLDAAEAANSVEATAQSIHAELQRTAPADGTGMVENFQKRYDEATKDIASQYSDPLTQQAVRVKIGDFKNKFSQDLYTESNVRFVKAGAQKLQDLMSTSTADIYLHPENYDQRLAEYTATVNAPGMDQFAPQIERDKMIRQFETDGALNAVRGQVKRGNFQGAREAVVRKFATVFKEDQRNNLLNEIDNDQSSYVNAKNQAADRAEKQAEKAHKQTIEQVSSDLFDRITSASNSVEREQARIALEESRANGTTDNTNYTFLKNQLNGVEKSTGNNLATHFTDRIYHMGDKGDQVMTDIMDASAELGPENTQRLIREARAERDRVKADPNRAFQLRAAMEQINARFGNPDIEVLMKEERKITRAQAIQEMSYLKDKGMDPREAAQKAIQHYAIGLNKLNPIKDVPYNLQFDLDGLDKAKDILLKQKPNLSPYEWNLRLNDYKERRRVLELEEADRAPKPYTGPWK